MPDTDIAARHRHRQGGRQAQRQRDSVSQGDRGAEKRPRDREAKEQREVPDRDRETTKKEQTRDTHRQRRGETEACVVARW